MKLTQEEFNKLINQKIEEANKPLMLKIEEYEKALKEIRINKPLIPEDEWNKMDKYVTTARLFKALVDGDEKWLSQYYKAVMTTSESDTPKAGYLLPEGFVSDVIEELAGLVAVRGLATVVPVSLKSGKQASITAKVSASRGTEGSETAAVHDIFGTLSYALTRVDVNMEYTRELEMFEGSAEGLYNILVRQASEAIADKEELDFLNGSGSGEPTGILNASGISMIDAGGGEPSPQNIIDAYYGVKAKYRAGASWVVSGNMIKTIRSMTYPGESQHYIWTDGFEATPNRILGRPVYESEQMVNTAIIFGNCKYYYIYEPPQMWVESTREGKTLLKERKVYVGIWKFNDGQVVLASAFGGVENIVLS